MLQRLHNIIVLDHKLKQASYLKKLPKHKGNVAENVAYLHIMLCVFAHTLFYAFISSRSYNSSTNNRKPNITCMRIWRRNESIYESGKLLIFSDSKYYAVFTIWEVFNILGVKMKYDIGKILEKEGTG